MITATSVMGVMKMGSTLPRIGLKLTSLSFRASVLPLNPHPPINAAPCLRGQCRLLQYYHYHELWNVQWHQQYSGSLIACPKLIHESLVDNAKPNEMWRG